MGRLELRLGEGPFLTIRISVGRWLLRKSGLVDPLTGKLRNTNVYCFIQCVSPLPAIRSIFLIRMCKYFQSAKANKTVYYSCNYSNSIGIISTPSARRNFVTGIRSKMSRRRVL